MASKRKRPADRHRPDDPPHLRRCSARNRPPPPPSPSPVFHLTDYWTVERAVVAAACAAASFSSSPSGGPAAPLRRLLSSRGVLPSLLLGPSRGEGAGAFGGAGRSAAAVLPGDDDDAAAAAAVDEPRGGAGAPPPPPPPPLESMPPPALSQLLSVLYDEVRAGRNVRSVLGFVERVVAARDDDGDGGGWSCGCGCGCEGAAAASGASGTGEAVVAVEDDGGDDGAGRACCGGSSGEGWVACLSFMVAYDALLGRVGRRASTGSGCGRDGALGSDGEDGREDILEDDAVVASALRIVGIVRRWGAARSEEAAVVDGDGGMVPSGGQIGKEEGEGRPITDRGLTRSLPSVVERCFGAQLARLDSIVETLGRSGGPEGDSPRGRSGEESTTAAVVATGEKDWWAGVDLGLDDDEEEDETDEGALAPMAGRTDGAGATLDSGTGSRADDVKADANSAPVADSAAPQQQADGGPSAGQPADALERAALELRCDLLDLPPGATSSDVQSHADRIAALIRRAGAENGASGVTTVGSLLACGRAGERGAESVAPGGEDDRHGRPAPLPFTDVLISALTKLCVDGGTSALRAAAYIRSFVLPLVMGMGGPPGSGKAAASRVLTSTVTGLARDRPAECVESLLLPALCGPSPMRPSVAGGERGTDDGAAKGGAYQPSQAQCELVGRVVKSVQLPKDTLARFAAGIISGSAGGAAASTSIASTVHPSDARDAGIAWTEFSMPVITACLNKRPSLPDEVIIALSNKIERRSTDMGKSMKFSTLFHTFVTKYGTQIQKAGSADVLRKAAGRLKTFMGKTLTSALKKL